MENSNNKNMEEDKENKIINHFESGSNCQVFNGNISGCVFAMPGSQVTQKTEPSIAELDDEQQDIAEKLKHIFYGQIEEAKNFLIGIQGLKPTEITAKVNELVGAKIISDRSHKHDLWKVLNDAGLYLPTESNWNQQVD